MKRIIQAIKTYKNFLITTHINLEGDALGSILAMRDILLYFKKRADIVIEDDVPTEYKFLPHIDWIKKIKDIRFSDYDVLFALDISDKKRCKRIIQLFPKDRIIISIDHHISNTRFAHINWIEPQASSTVELIYKLYRKLNIPLNKKRAVWLYVGLLTDTGSFRYPNTTFNTFKLAEKFASYGLDVNSIYQNIYYNLTFEEIKRIAEVLSTIKSTKDRKIVWFRMKNDNFRKRFSSDNITDKILDLGRAIKDAEVVVLFKDDLYNKDKISINLRSKGKVDVDKIARFFGGGGHRTASGCNIKGNLKDIEEMVIKKVKESVR
jgi:phosphoesterase RecJ-like protein